MVPARRGQQHALVLQRACAGPRIWKLGGRVLQERDVGCQQPLGVLGRSADEGERGVASRYLADGRDDPGGLLAVSGGQRDPDQPRRAGRWSAARTGALAGRPAPRPGSPAPPAARGRPPGPGPPPGVPRRSDRGRGSSGREPAVAARIRRPWAGRHGAGRRRRGPAPRVIAGEAPAGLHPPRGRFGQRDRIVEPAPARAIRARSTSVIPSGLGPPTSKASAIAVASSSRADLDEGGGQEHVRAEMRGLVGPVRRLADALSGQVERFDSPARVPPGHGEHDHRGHHQLTALGAGSARMVPAS